MKLVENLHHSDESSGTAVILDGCKELRVHWTEGYSDAVICEGMGGPIAGLIRANGELTHDDWEDLKPILAAPGINARPMTQEEERDHAASMSLQY
jgi:hypothetical protein